MSIDKSLRRKNTLVRARSVLTRGERIATLKEEERWTEGRSPFGLPKVKVKVIKKAKKAKEEAKVEGAEGAAAAGAAAPAAAAAAPAKAAAAKAAPAKAAPAKEDKKKK
jgi:small basic protein (TIGR04137 family)